MIAIKEIEIYKPQVEELEKQATELSIATPEQNASAIELKGKLNKTWKEIEAKKESITKPMNEALRNTRALFSPLEDACKLADYLIGKALLTYKKKVELDNQKKELQIAARVEKGTMKMETAEKKLENLPQVQKTVQTSAGQVQFRKLKRLKITSLDLIPDQYWVVDEVKLRKDVLAGIVVPGAEVEEYETV